MAEPIAPPAPTAAQRWLARLAFALALASVLVLIVGATKNNGVLIAGVVGAAATLAGGWWFLSNRGPARWFGAALCIAAPIFVLVFYLVRNYVWQVLLAAALAALALEAAREALKRALPEAAMPESETPAPQRPFIIMNPHSGGGKVGRFGLDSKAKTLGAEVSLLEGSGHIDVAALAKQAAAGGADLLGVAGGDGTQALVAGIAAERDLPFLVVSAGTRNHFAMDLGLDREHPDACLDALSDGVELRMDLGCIGDRTFVNNASFGAYAEVVQSPAYRDDKVGTTLSMLPDLLSGHAGPRLVVHIDDKLTIEAPRALLVSNNPYDFSDPAGLGRRPRLDGGALGVVAVTVQNAGHAADLLRGRRGRGLRQLLAHEVVIDADADEIAVGIDGEAIRLPTPVRCTIRPLVLRVRVPRDRPGVPPAKPTLSAGLLLHQALGRPYLNQGE
jgi:diacylglycerol kinase family enzyme